MSLNHIKERFFEVAMDSHVLTFHATSKSITTFSDSRYTPDKTMRYRMTSLTNPTLLHLFFFLLPKLAKTQFNIDVFCFLVPIYLK